MDICKAPPIAAPVHRLRAARKAAPPMHLAEFGERNLLVPALTPIELKGDEPSVTRANRQRAPARGHSEPGFLIRAVALEAGGVTDYFSFSSAQRRMAMTWMTPTLIEICIGLEINGYLPAEF